MPWNIKWHLAISLAFIVIIGVLWRVQAAPERGMVWSGYGTLPWVGDRGPDSTGQMCFGEDSQARTQLSGTLGPSETTQAALAHVCVAWDGSTQGTGGGAALRVEAKAKGNTRLEARIVKPDGQVVTHADGLVCLSGTVWTSVPGKPEPVGDGGLSGGDYRLEVRNVGDRAAKNVIVDYQLHMGYTFNAVCPAGDILVDGR